MGAVLEALDERGIVHAIEILRIGRRVGPGISAALTQRAGDPTARHQPHKTIERPAALRERLQTTYGITPYDSDVIVSQGRPLVDFYLELAGLSGDGKAASNWTQQDVLRTLGERGIAMDDCAHSLITSRVPSPSRSS